MKKNMAEYQNALEEMSSEAIEYVRGIPVVKTFGQSVFSYPADTSITFENVSFRYQGAADDALHDVTLKINAGEQVAFVGPSGGVNVKNIDEKELMDTVSFVFQDSHLLKMSIMDNVRMGKKDATRQEVMEALKNAQCGDIIEKLPDGTDTVIGSKGTYLSGGEAQRIAIARQ